MQIIQENFEQSAQHTQMLQQTLQVDNGSLIARQKEQELFQEQKDQDLSLEKELLNAIDLIEIQTAKIQGPIDGEIIFLLGNTGCGKSTLFNWLIGNKLIVKRDETLKAANWIVETEITDNTDASTIGHIQTSTTTIPKLGKSNFGPYIVDFPGWQDTRGWQYDFVNQIVAENLTTHCQKIKILFICDVSVFKSDRGAGIKELVNNINSFAQGKSVHTSAMFVITKLQLDDEEDKYKEDIRDHCKTFLTNNQSVLCDETKTIIKSLIENDMFIMEKASRYKKEYTEEERQNLQDMIIKLKSQSIKLQVYVSNQIEHEFFKYFNEEIEKIKQYLRSMMKNIDDIQKKLNENNDSDQILSINSIISQAKNILLKNSQNQIKKFLILEDMYTKMSKVIQGDLKINLDINRNFIKIYNHFYQIKDKIHAYDINFIRDDDFHFIFAIEIQLSELLKSMKKNNRQQSENEKKEFENLRKTIDEQQKKLDENERQQNREYNNMRRQIENTKRHVWWFIWKKPRIPDWVQDVDKYIQMGG